MNLKNVLGLPCRLYLSPLVSPSPAPVFSCAHYFHYPGYFHKEKFLRFRNPESLHEAEQTQSNPVTTDTEGAIETGAPNGHLSTTVIFLADSPYIHSCEQPFYHGHFPLSPRSSLQRSSTVTSLMLKQSEIDVYKSSYSVYCSAGSNRQAANGEEKSITAHS